MSSLVPPLHPSCVDLTGQRVGRLVVEGPGPRCLNLKTGRYVHRWWRVVCDCGWRGMIRGSSLRLGRSRKCLGCHRRNMAARGRATSVRLPSGRAIVEVAESAGVSLNTVYQRYLRGWAEADLSLPVVGKKGRRQGRPEVSP